MANNNRTDWPLAGPPSGGEYKGTISARLYAEPTPNTAAIHGRFNVKQAAVLAASIAPWQQALWRFHSVGHIGKVGGPTAWMEPVTPLAARHQVRVAFPEAKDIEGDEVRLYLAVADAGDGPRPFTLFVKRVHNWRHSPAFAGVPPEIGEWAASSVPWRAEPLLYAFMLAVLFGERIKSRLAQNRLVHSKPAVTAPYQRVEPPQPSEKPSH